MTPVSREEVETTIRNRLGLLTGELLSHHRRVNVLDELVAAINQLIDWKVAEYLQKRLDDGQP